MKRRILAFLLTISLLTSALPMPVFAAKLAEQREQKTSQSFKDVKPGDWYYNAVMEAVENNIFAGTSEDTFSVDAPMTRGMYVTVLSRMAKMSGDYSVKENMFTDVKPGAYYASAVRWAVEMGITKGIAADKFGPDSPVTREQMAIFIVRFFDAYDITYPDIIAKDAPADLDTVNDYAKSAVMQLWNTGLLRGDEKGNFSPKKNATRVEVAAFSVRVNKTTIKSVEAKEEARLEKEKLEEEEAKPKPEPKPTPKPDGGGGSSGGGDNDNNSGGGGQSSYYQISFNSNGGSDVGTKRVQGDTRIGDLPVPTKDKEVFGGWYYDAGLTKRVGDMDRVNSNLTLYAKYGIVASVVEEETPTFGSAQDQGTGFTIQVTSSESMSADEVKRKIKCGNLSNPDDTDPITVSGSGTSFTISGKGGFEAGATYKLLLESDSLKFQGLEATARQYNFTIKKEDVLKLGLNKDIKYIPFSDISNMEEDGKKVKALSTGLLKMSNDDESDVTISEVKKGTFEYDKDLSVGDTVTIYKGVRPDQRGLEDIGENAGGEIAYVEITEINGNTYSFKNAEAEDVLFKPDILPVDIDLDQDGERFNKEITVDEVVMEFSDDVYSEMELDSQTTVDIGDFLALYEGDFGEEATIIGYGLITKVTEITDETDNKKRMTIHYEDADEADMLASMDLYNSQDVDGDALLENVDREALEANIEQQARDSGFAEEAAMYLADMALKTDAFTELSDDFTMTDFQMQAKGDGPTNIDEIRLMADGSTVEVKLSSIKASLSTYLQHFDKRGVRLTLDVAVEITITASDDTEIVMNITGSFEEEVHVNINVKGGAKWKKKHKIFPYIADYQATASIDLYNYTGIEINATMATKEKDEEHDWDEENEWFKDNKWFKENEIFQNGEIYKVVDISKQLKELLDGANEYFGEDEESVSDGLSGKYQEMLKTESDWVNLFEQEIFSQEFGVDPFQILVVEIAMNFIVSVNMNVSVGCDFYYENGKRYIYNVSVFNKKVTSDVIDLVEEKYEFTFYIMGTLGIRAGIKVEVNVGIISTKLGSVGFSAESGAYVRLWGYFYYNLKYSASKGKTTSYSGALLVEVGVYLEILFNAQAFAGTFSHEIELYANEWPLWSAGVRKNVTDFSYKETEDLTMKKDIKALKLPDELFSMTYLDLKNGDIEQKIYDDGKDFKIDITNKAFTYNPATNMLAVAPGKDKAIEEGKITLTWKGAPLAFTSAPMTRVFNLQWDNLNDGYSIIFNTNGGSSVPMLLMPYNKLITPPAAPTKLGYVFDDWYADSAFKTKYSIPKTMPNIDSMVYAKWVPAKNTKYRVVHHKQNLADNTYTIVTKDTEALEGITDSIVKTTPKAYEGFKAPVAKDLKINPDGSALVEYYYDRNSYEMIFNSGEEGEKPLVFKLKYETPTKTKNTSIVPRFSKVGYIFESWNQEVPKLIEATSMTFFAQWSPNTDTPYRVEQYVQNAEDGRYVVTATNKTGTTDETIDIEQFKIIDPIDGTVFKGSTVDGEEATSTSLKGDGSLVIKLYYTQVNTDYSVEHHYQNTIDDEYTIDETQTIKKTGATGDELTLVDFEIKTDGMTFKESKVGKKVAETTELKGDSSLVIKLYYTRNNYTMAHKVTNGEETEIVADKIYRFGQEIAFPEILLKDGYEFSGWKNNEELTEAFKLESMPASHLTAYGEITPKGDTVFKVEHYYQNIEDDNYTLDPADGADEKTGVTGESVALSDLKRDPEGMTYKEAKVDEIVTDSPAIKGDGSLTVKLYYVRNEYTMTHEIINAGQVETIPNKTYRYGEKIDLPLISDIKLFYPIVLVKPGYVFSGWTQDADYKEVFIVTTMPAEDTTVYGEIIPGSATRYKVIHYLQNVGGEGYTWIDTDFLDGVTDALTKATAKSYDGFEVKDFKQETIAGDGGTEVRIEYDRIPYTISLDLAGGSLEGDHFINYTYRDDTKLPEPTRTGYDFGGWYEGEERIFIITGFGDKTYRAKWDSKWDTKYTVKHLYEDLDGKYTIKETEERSGSTGEKTTVTSNQFADGFTAGSFEQKAIEADGSTVIEIKYSRNSYNLSWQLTDDSLQVEFEKPSQGSIKFGQPITKPTVKKVGYSFSGWYIDEIIEGNRFYDDVMPAKDVAAYGKLTESVDITYDISHYMQNLRGDQELEQITGQRLMGSAGDIVTAEPLEFDYCDYNPADGRNKLTGTITADGNLSLEVYYTPRSFTLSYDVDGVEYHTAVYKYTERIIHPTQIPSKDGYRFIMWNLVGASDTSPTVNWMPKENTTLTPVWIKDTLSTVYTVTYEVDGKQYGDVVQYKQYDRVEYPVVDANNEGLIVTHWTLDGAKFNGRMPNENITLEAVWGEDTGEEFTVTYEGVYGQNYEVGSYKRGETVIHPSPSPTSDDWIFGGWSLDTDYPNVFSGIMPGNDIVLIPIWTKVGEPDPTEPQPGGGGSIGKAGSPKDTLFTFRNHVAKVLQYTPTMFRG